MLELALTGGIGSGKSTVGRGLVERGAVLVDADAIVRGLQQRGSPVFHAILGLFGDEILAPGGELDRATLGRIVFSDPVQLERLNSIVHPSVRAEMVARRNALAAIEEDGGSVETVVIFDIPLLAESAGVQGGFAGALGEFEEASQKASPSSGRTSAKGRTRVFPALSLFEVAGVIVVDASPETVVARLKADRGLTEEEIRARMSRQAARAERLAIADFVLRNDGTMDDLEEEVDRCWQWIRGLRPSEA